MFVSDDGINDNDDNSTDKNEDERTSAASYDEDVSDNSTDSPDQQNETVSIIWFISTLHIHFLKIERKSKKMKDFNLFKYVVNKLHPTTIHHCLKIILCLDCQCLEFYSCSKLSNFDG